MAHIRPLKPRQERGGNKCRSQRSDGLWEGAVLPENGTQHQVSWSPGLAPACSSGLSGDFCTGYWVGPVATSLY